MALIIKAGGTSQNGFVIEDLSGNPIDLTGAEFQFLIKEKHGGDDLYRYTQTDIPDPELGIVNVKIPPTETAGFPEGSYPSEVRLTNVSGDIFYSQIFKSRVESIIDIE